MAALAGRDVRIKYDDGGGYDAIAGARVDNFTLNRGAIDITDKDDAGVRTLLDAVGTFSAEMTVSGVLVGTTLIDLAKSVADDAQLHDFQIEAASIGTYSGSFFISGLELGGEDGEEAATFSCTLMSSGTLTWAAA